MVPPVRYDLDHLHARIDYLVDSGCVELFLPTFHGMSLLRWMS